MSCDVKLKEYVDDLTKCPICLEYVANPKSLPCFHIFCLQCIGKHCRYNSPGDQMHCPVCRSSFVIPDDGVDQLPDNFFIKGLADVKKSSDKSSEIFPCDGCSDGSADEANNIMPATMQCIGCGQNLCEKCSKPHRRIPGGGHEVVPSEMDLLRKTLESRGSFCGRHAGNRLEIYCIECNENMCVTCGHGNKHREHYLQVRPIDEVYVEFQKTIEHDIQLVLDKEKSVQEKAAASMIEQQQVEDEIMSKETDLSRINGEIMSKVDEAVRQLTVLLSDEKTEVSKIATARNNEFEFELAAFHSFTRYSSELMKKGKPCEITHAYIELHARAGELLQREVKTDDYKLPASTVSSRDLYDEIFDYSAVNSARYQARKTRAATEMRRLAQEKDEVDQRLKELTMDYDAMVNQLEAENIVVTRERDKFKDDRSKLITEKEQLNKDIDGITEERDKFKEDCSKLIAEKEQLQKDKDGITNECDTLKDHLSKVNAEKEQLKKDNDGITKERNTLKDHLFKVNAEKEQLKKDNDGITKERKTLKDDFSKLITEKEQLRKDKDGITNECDTLKDHLSKVNAEKEQLKRDKDGNTKERNLLKDHLSKVNAEQVQLKKDNDGITKERNTLKDDCSKLITEKEQLKKDKDGITKERNTLKDYLSKVIAEKEQLKKDNDGITKERNTLKDDCSKHIAEKEQLKKDKDGITKERNTLKDDCSKLIAEKEQLKKDKDGIANECDTLKDHLSKVTARKEQLKQDKDGITKERDTLKDHLSKVNAEKEQLKKDNDGITKERNTLKDDCSKLIAEKEQLKKDKDGITNECDTLKDHLSKLAAEKEILFGKVSTVKVIHSTNDAKPISGMTILNRKIYVGHRDTTDIKVYDTETFTKQRTLRVPRLGRVTDMTSCKIHQCIYIADNINNVVHRVDSKNTITQWPVKDEINSLSVNSANNVLITCKGKVKVFTTDGKLVGEINLESSIVSPNHTVELTTDQLVVSHGFPTVPGHRVCIVDLSGRVLQSYGESKEQGSGRLNVPIRLAVNAGVVFVADYWNDRVLMLSSTLSLIREVVSGQRNPFRICLDAETRRLYVVEQGYMSANAGKIVVYTMCV